MGADLLQIFVFREIGDERVYFYAVLLMENAGECLGPVFPARYKEKVVTPLREAVSINFADSRRCTCDDGSSWILIAH